MKQLQLFLFFLVVTHLAWSQATDFPMGRVSLADVEMRSYPADSSADAVVLNEQGQAYFSEDGGIGFEHYLKIKILNKKGFRHANFTIPLHRQGDHTEQLVSLTASSYNLQGVSLKEIKMDPSNVFSQSANKFTDIKKFTLPDVREGTVLEVKYKMLSPFWYNFRTWIFQDDIPKAHSEFWAMIPGPYVYNITLRGYLKLSKSESSIVNECFTLQAAGKKIDCGLLKYAMENVPAFKEEEHMTARKNWISAIYFELTEIHHVDGRVDKIAREWKDVDKELALSDNFGLQIKKAKSLLDDKIKTVVGAEADKLVRAKLVHHYIKTWYTWNEVYGIYTDLGAKKSYESRTGNVADINLSLVAALQDADLDAFPVILSTREFGVPIELHPVMTDFNYVVASLEIDGKLYLLDALDPHQPFGLLPVSCLNGKGRRLTKESSWIEMKSADKQKTSIAVDLNLTKEGFFEGHIAFTYQGYDALRKRGELFSAGESEYLGSLRKKWDEVEISNHQIENLNDLEKPLMEKMEIKMNSGFGKANTIFFNPFLAGKISKNPFRSSERFFPVDFGAPVENIFILNLNYPADMEVDELPKNIALTLPRGGGRYIFSVSSLGNKLSMVNNLYLNKAIYDSEEYHYLKELYTQMLQIQQSQIVFKRKP